VIVRIATEGQYDVDDSVTDQLNEADNKVVEAVDAGDESGFQSAYEQLLSLVREHGTELGDDDLSESALILPPPDLTFEEASEQFTGDGLIPD
jgi:hypothetical protein